MRMAEQAIHSHAEAKLSPERFQEMKAAEGTYLFVSGMYPGSEWTDVVGFVPDPVLFYQVTVGIAVDPGEPENVFATALISRDISSDFCHIIWEPSQLRAPLSRRPGA